MTRARRDTQPLGMYGYTPPPPPGPRWREMSKGGAEHLMELRGPPGNKRWESLCGGWAGEGYAKIDRAVTRCRACMRIAK